MVRSLAFLLVAALGIGCASMSGGAQPDPAAVVVTDDADRVADCTLRSTVAVDPPFILLTKSYPETVVMGREDMRAQLRREAAAAGGDTVLTTGIEDGKMHGTAYRCG